MIENKKERITENEKTGKLGPPRRTNKAPQKSMPIPRKMRWNETRLWSSTKPTSPEPPYEPGQQLKTSLRGCRVCFRKNFLWWVVSYGMTKCRCTQDLDGKRLRHIVWCYITITMRMYYISYISINIVYHIFRNISWCKLGVHHAALKCWTPGKTQRNLTKTISSWWFQPIWKKMVKLDRFPRGEDEKNIWNRHLTTWQVFWPTGLALAHQVPGLVSKPHRVQSSVLFGDCIYFISRFRF